METRIIMCIPEDPDFRYYSLSGKILPRGNEPWGPPDSRVSRSIRMPKQRAKITTYSEPVKAIHDGTQ